MEDAKAMSEHTPGPWEVGKTLLPPHRIDGIWSHDGMHICSFAHCMSIEPEQEALRANANLIAAAPLMLAALEAVEWSDETRGLKFGWPTCPLCMGVKYAEWPEDEPLYRTVADFHAALQPHVGHHADCQLAAAIQAARGEP